MRRFVAGLLVAVSALCVVLSSTSLWARRYVVDTEVFVSEARVMLAEPAVQVWIGSRLTDTVVQHAVDETAALLPPELAGFWPAVEGPAVEGAVRPMVGEGVDALLTSDAFSTGALASAHAQLLEGRPVRLTVGQAVSAVSTQNPVGPAAWLLDLLPDDIGVTVLTPQDAPHVYTAVELLKLLPWWLWTGLLAIAALVGALVVSRRPLGTVRAWAVTASGLGLLLLIALPAARASVLALVEPGSRDAAGALYTVLTDGLCTWTLWLLTGTAVVAVGASVTHPRT
jgi:ligand-binding sensor domain-containing protein